MKAVSSSTIFSEALRSTFYTEAEIEEREMVFIGTESEARRRFQKNGPYRPRSRPRYFSKIQGLTDPEEISVQLVKERWKY